MANSDWKVQLEAIIDSSSLTNAQKELAKQKLKIGVEIQGKEASLQSIDALKNAMMSFQTNNTKMTKDMKARLNEMYKTLVNGANLSQKEVQELRHNFNALKLEVRDAGKLGKSFGDSIKSGMASFATWLPASQLIMSGVNGIRNMITNVKDLDTALVDLKKTTDATAQQLEDFYYQSNDTAKRLGVETKEIINTASAWSRLGYAIKDASIMAENSAIMASISPEMDINTATDGLVSTLKAFKIEAEDSLDGVISKINIIGNTQAVDNNDIVNILTRSSSAMAEANNTLEETIALGTAATEITRDADAVGTMLKTVSMRIRGYDEETESYTSDLANLSGTIADLTKTASSPGGISLFTDESKTTYKSTYQILKDISEIYDELDDKTQAQLLEALAGKRQGQAVAAIINNFENAEKSMNSMANSAGNAMEEMEIIYDSLDYKLNKTKETATGISQNLFGREDMKMVVDIFNDFLGLLDKVTEKIGLFGTIGLGAGLFASFKGAGRVKIAYPHLYTYACRNKTLYA